MKNLFILITVFLTVWTTSAQTEPTIVKPEVDQTSYIINSASGPKILNATNSIQLLPGAHIRQGSDFRAYIVDGSNTPPLVTGSGDDGENYIHSRSYQRGMPSPIGISSNSDVIEQITYFDGLGRPMQNISIKASPDLKDIVTHIDYDGYGRMVKEFLPYEANGTLGSLRAGDQELATQNFYKNLYPDDFAGISAVNTNPYSEREFEPSPLNRVLKQAAPGEDWKLGNGHEIRLEYSTNIANEVRNFQVNLSGDYIPELSLNGHYNAGELYKNSTKDENWQEGQGNPNDHTTEEFTDKQGRVILKRTYNLNVPHDTYYVYDDFGNLTYVLPPKVDLSDGQVSAAELDGLCYQYRYDYRNRLIEKKIPGKGTANDWESIVYNKLDQPIMMQDPNLKAQNKWLFTRYDSFGRVAYTGIVIGGTRESHQLAADVYSNNQNNNLWVNRGNHQISGRNTGYDNSGYPRSGYAELLIINHYDDYDYTRDEIEKPTSSIMGQQLASNVKGLPTVSKVRVLEPSQLPVDDIVFQLYNASSNGPIAMICNGNVFSSAQGINIRAFAPNNAQSVRITLSGGQSRSFVDNEAPYALWDDVAGNYYAANMSSGSYTIRAIAYSGDGGSGSIIADTSISFSIGGTYNNNCNPPIYHEIEDGLSTQWITTLTAYDQKGRVIYTKTENPYLGTTDITETKLDFAGKVIDSRTTHTKGSNIIVVNDEFEYDHMARLKSQKQQINNQAEEVLFTNTYDGIGQLIKKDVGNTKTNPLQEVDYKYNVRGWLTDIGGQGDFFTMGIQYNKMSANHVQNTFTPLYNGNISETQWSTSTNEAAGYGNLSRNYTYTYDALNRLSAADSYSVFGRGSGYPAGNGTYSVSNISYDRNGNILTLDRKGEGYYWDELVYSYSDFSNKLSSVTDNTTGTKKNEGFHNRNTSLTDYIYDSNGNMILDANKGISNITYNHLNLPMSIDISNLDHVGTISYIYDATGVKLQKNVLTNGNTKSTDYAGNYIYENNQLQFLSTPEGYVEPKNSNNLSLGYNYVYQYKDHLGNVRLSYADLNDDGEVKVEDDEILEENNYYPFGLEHKGYNNVVNGVENNYQTYQGQELTEDLGYNMLEYKQRHFDPAIARFNKLDRFAEKYTPVSPYSFVANNPLKYREVQGDSIQLIIGKPYTDYKGKEHPYGHVALRVFNAEEGYDYVYDFGRYGAVRGVFGQTGDGILNVYNNSEAYFKTEQSIRESIGYTEATTVAQDKKIIDYYNKQISEGEPYSKRNTKNSKSYKLDDYGIFDNNCCTVSADGLEQVGKNYLGDEYDPRDALKVLEKNYKKLGLTRTVYKKGGITITTYEPAKPNSSGKSGNQQYDERPIPRVKDPEE